MKYILKHMNSPFKTLKNARKAKRLSQAALSKMLGIPQSHLSKLESGQIDPRYSSVVQLARSLDYELVLVPTNRLVAVNAIIENQNTQEPAWLPDEDGELSDE